FQHVKPGKGAAFVRVKIKNIITGSTVEKTFNPNDKYEKARIEKREMQYLYSDGELFYFMDTETYEQQPLGKDQLGDALKYVKENDTVEVLSYKDKVFGVEPPFFVVLEITDTEPGYAGNTAQGANKPATVETGATIKVPLFINVGDKVRVDTRSGDYMERA
ncbi:MAG: elongation factor P, partial [Clostridiales bacterium]|nr:elongation factor P [Clostridiales bacterium]